ncbi:GNAT family N-acetyltransferase [Neobacillus drentensis]|uniref:GNAT family N-acetyltransferase n=1 Tax=Neobacillus drentensis TaxID=220684 RepID=UPI003000921B
MYEVKEINLDTLRSIETNGDIKQTVFKTKEWLTFLEKNGKGKSVVLQITEGNETLAFFVGMVFKQFGIKIMGSPFEGWATCNMGFCARETVDRLSLIEIVKKYVFNNLKCLYMEIVDVHISCESLKNFKYHNIPQSTYVLNINRPDEELFKSFKSNCQRLIRQFERRGAAISQVKPTIEFANEYYDQLIDVFEKQNLKPNYNRKKVIDLISAFQDNPEGLLCLKVCDPNGKCIATSIFPGLNDTCYFWGGASYREYQNYRPNEYMFWYAIKYWRDRGATAMDMVGLREYKKKFSPDLVVYPRIIISKYRFLITVRNGAKKAIQFFRKIRGA